MSSLLLMLPILVAIQDGATKADAALAPRVKLSADRFDFGTVRAGTTVSGELEIRNEGDAPLLVTRVGVTCECANLKLSTPTRLNVPIDTSDDGRTDLSIAPGTAATLKLTMDTEKLAAGLFEKRCLIVCSDTTKSPLSVPFTATIERAPHRENRGDRHDEADKKPAPAEPLFTDGPPPRIEADSCKAEFGEVYRGEKLFHTFKIKNRGTGQLELKEIRSTCACAVAELKIGDKSFSGDDLRDKKGIGALAPEEEATLKVELKTAKETTPGRDALLSKSIQVYNNDPTNNPLVLTLEAKMISPFTIEPDRFAFGKVRKGSAAKISAVIYSDKLGPFTITGASTPNSELLKVKVENTVPSGDAAGRPPTWRVDVELSPAAPLGTFNTHVDLAIEHERVKEIVIPVYLSVEPNVSFVGNRPDGGEFLDFDKMIGESDKTVELKIDNGDAAIPYVPKSVVVEARPVSSAFKAELVEVEKGISYVIKVTAPKTLGAPGDAKPTGRSQFFMGDVVITADHPDVPVKKVKFRGWYMSPGK